MQKCRFISLLLATGVLSSMFTGCGNESKPVKQEGSSQKPASQQGSSPKQEVMEISFVNQGCGNAEEGSYCEKLVENAMAAKGIPVDIKVKKVDTDNKEQLNLMLSSGEMPDISWLFKGITYMKNEELVRTIPITMIEQFAPSYLKLYDKYPLVKAVLTDKEDKTQFNALTGITESYTRIAVGIMADMYRYDWIQKLGIDLGDMKVEKIADRIYAADKGPTVEKFTEIMEKFTTGDPDGNGKNDTMGASLHGASPQSLITSGFGFITGVNNNNGKADNYYVLPAYKEFVKSFANMYQKGYIDKEWLTQKRDLSWEKINAGTVGYWQSSSNSLNSWAKDRPPITFLENIKEGEVLLMPGLTASDGKGHMPITLVPSTSKYCFINKKVDDKKLEVILQVLEYTNFGEDVLSLQFGEKDVDWKEEGGRAKIINKLKAGEKGNVFFFNDMQIGALWESLTLEPEFEAGSKFWLGDDAAWKKHEVRAYKSDIRGETNYSAISSDKGGDITAARDQWFSDWILGKEDVDKTWDKYLQELNDLGYREMMDELDKVKPVEDLIKEFSK